MSPILIAFCGFAFGPAIAASASEPISPQIAKSSASQNAAAKVSAPFEVRLIDGKSKSWPVDELAALPRHKCTVKDRSGKSVEYEGPLLSDMLAKSGVVLGHDLRGKRMTEVAVAEAPDGYRVVFALPELDPDFVEQTILLADRRDGKALDDKEGPYKIVTPREKRPTRGIRNVSKISIQNVAK